VNISAYCGKVAVFCSFLQEALEGWKGGKEIMMSKEMISLSQKRSEKKRLGPKSDEMT
jgi:hypothetical protein